MRARPTLLVLFATALLTTALAAVLYLGRQLFGAPFVPGAIYDWLGRGGVRLSRLSAALAGDNPARDLAPFDWLVALALFFIPALLAGWLLHAWSQRRGYLPDMLDGLLTGGLFGAPLILVSLVAGRSALHPVFQTLWLAACFLAWGVALSATLRRLASLPDGRQATGETEALPPAGGMDRRRFLLTLGASTAAITALSAAAGAALGDAGARLRLPRDFPTAGPEFREAQAQLLGNFRRFAIVRVLQTAASETEVLALGTEYPDQAYVSIWLGEGSPIVIYDSLETAQAAYSAGGESEIIWLDH